MKLIIQSIYLMSILSQTGLGLLSMIGGIAVIVFAYITREETDPEWYKANKSQTDKAKDKTDQIGLYFSGIGFVLLGIGMLLDVAGLVNF
jgi:hypothetical protein